MKLELKKSTIESYHGQKEHGGTNQMSKGAGCGTIPMSSGGSCDPCCLPVTYDGGYTCGTVIETVAGNNCVVVRPITDPVTNPVPVTKGGSGCDVAVATLKC